MNRAQVESEIRLILIRQLSVEPDELTLGCHFEDDLKADSLDLVEIIMMVEDRFNLTIHEETAANLKTLGDLITYVCEARCIPEDAPAVGPSTGSKPTDVTQAPAVRDCKSCGAHAVAGAVCVYCGRAV